MPVLSLRVCVGHFIAIIAILFIIWYDQCYDDITYYAQMVLYPLLGLKNVSTLTLLALCKETVAILVDNTKNVILSKLHTCTRSNFYLIIATMQYLYMLLFRDVRCGQLHCQDSGHFRLSVGAGVIVSTKSVYILGEGIVECRYNILYQEVVCCSLASHTWLVIYVATFL